MPTMQCPGCGKAVRFEGVAGVCPNCAAVVRAPRSAPGAGGGGPQSTSGKSRRPTSVNQLQAIATGDEVFTPPNEAGGGGRPGELTAMLKGLDPRVLAAIVAAAVLLVGFGLYTVLHRPAPTVGPLVVVAPPPPGPVATAPPPPPVVDVAVAPAGPTPKATGATRPTVVLPAWYGLHPVRPDIPADPFTDAAVEKSMRRAAAVLKPKMGKPIGDPAGVAPDANAVRMGATCLATYALLHTGEALDDPDLGVSSRMMSEQLQLLKAATPDGMYQTYGYSMRLQALGLAGRDADRQQLGKDQAWMLKAETDGAFSYTAPSSPADKPSWDHSNCQYGVLGLWAAADAGLSTPARVWSAVERHWVDTQAADGGWGYEGRAGSSPAMTAAGITSLSVASEQLVTMTAAPPSSAGGHGAARPAADAGPAATALASAVDRGLAYLGTGDRLMDPGLDGGYTLYGIERAALATGYRFFGDHDWYRDLGRRALAAQESDGGWGGRYGTDIGTSFRLLFLARGRQPLLMDKLKFDGGWNDRPRDVAKLVGYASAQLERPFAWGVADVKRDWWTWLDAPLVFATVDRPPALTDDDVRKLRAYADAGGFLVIHNEFASKDVDAWAADLAKQLYPQYPMTKAAPDDLLYRSLFTIPPARQPPLMVVGNGARPLMVYSPTDLSRAWLGFRPKEARPSVDLQVGLNLFVAAAGKAEFRSRLNSPYLDLAGVAPLGTVPVQRVQVGGGRTNPEPAAWDRFGRWFLTQTGLAVQPELTDVRTVDIHRGPVAVLTGTGPLDAASLDLHALADFVRAGGTLVIDADGGDKAFAKAVHEDLLPLAFGGLQPNPMPPEHPILAGVGDCMTPLPKPRVRRFVSEQVGMGNAPPVQVLTYGSGTVIVSDLDLTTALLHSSTYGVYGYTPDYADALYKNAILWTLSRFQPPPGVTMIPATEPTAGPTTAPAAR